MAAVVVARKIFTGGVAVRRQCRTFEHTADVGLEARADDLGELLAALAEGLADLVAPREQVSPREGRTLAVRADDPASLAVDFLNELAAALQSDRFLVAEVRVASADETSVDAELLGEPYDARRHEYATEVKAATYHEIQVAEHADGWLARVILDI
jgi:SHS2 domain-containing protein